MFRLNDSKYRFIILDEDDEIDDSIFQKMFNKFDEDGSGLISKSELSQAMKELNPKITDDDMKDIIENACFDDDDQLNYENFIKIVK